MTDKQAKWIAIVVAVVVVALLAVCYCRGRRDTFAWVSACGADSVRIVVKKGGDPTPTTYSQLPISGPITDIPEFNDCQRFMKGGKYGASYAIFVAYYLEQAWGRLAGELSHDTVIPVARLGASHVVIPVATIYSYGESYAALGIRPGFNCLFLHRDTAQGSPVEARMVPWGETDPDCGAVRPADEGPDDRLNTGKDLDLQPATTSTFAMAFTSKDFPPVARWDFDSVNNEHYIGLTCGSRWCQIGDAGFQSSNAITLPAAFAAMAMPPVLKNRTSAIRGWYDEQRLASIGPEGAQPGTPSGELIPHPQLDALNATTDSYTKKWVQVAVARVDAAYKFFKQGENTIELCHGAGKDCTVPSGDRRCAAQPDDEGNWWARISAFPGPSNPVYKCVKRMDHKEAIDAFNATHTTKVRIPGTVRWRWREDDETTWISCETGCCTVRS